MAPLPSAPGIIQATFKATDSTTGRPIINVLHFEKAGYTNPDMAALLALLQPGWADYFSAACGNTYTPGSIRLDGLDHAAPYYLEGPQSAPAGSPGASAGPTICYLIKLQSGIRGRANEGRVYLGPAQTADLTGSDSRPSAALITAVNANMVTFLGAVSGGGFSWVILHKATGAHTQITSATVEALCATQRRRLRK